MAKVQTFSCDICKNWKKEDTDWWYGSVSATRQISLTPFNGSSEFADKINHLCGIECSTKWVAQQMAK